MVSHSHGSLIQGALTERILGHFYEVYGELGYGFLESVYEAALHLTLERAGLSVQRQAPIAVYFRGTEIGSFRADIVVQDAVVLELKSVRALE